MPCGLDLQQTRLGVDGDADFDTLGLSMTAHSAVLDVGGDLFVSQANANLSAGLVRVGGDYGVAYVAGSPINSHLVEIRSEGATQIVSSESFNDLSLVGSGRVDLASSTTIAGTLQSERLTDAPGGPITTTVLQLSAGFSTNTPDNFLFTSCQPTVDCNNHGLGN